MVRITLTILAFIFCIGSAFGDTYKYLNDKGTPCFTNETGNIPLKYRSKAALISKDEKLPEPRPADRVDESLLPKKEEASYKVDASAGHAPILEPEGQDFPYLNVAIISSMFLGTLISAVFVDNRNFKKLMNIVSLASMITLLVYVSVFFFSKHMHTLKKNALEMTEAMKKKEAQKQDAIQDIVGVEEIKLKK